MEAVKTLAPTDAQPFWRFALEQTEALDDVSALLAAIAGWIEAHATMNADDPMPPTLRLAEMAQKQVRAIVNALDPYTLPV